MVNREFVKKIITFEANGFMVYWSLPWDCSYVERKMIRHDEKYCMYAAPLSGEWCICSKGEF